MLRKILRTVGLGRLLLYLKHLMLFNPKELYFIHFKFRRLLLKARNLKPIPCDQGELEIHMLLRNDDIYSAAWAIYSLIFFSRVKFRLVIHDDGTIKKKGEEFLGRLFPGYEFVSRTLADLRMNSFFSEKKLTGCKRLRDGHIFALKLFDPFFFSKSKWIVVLDSDILFYAKPHELLTLDESGVSGQVPNLYMYDPNPYYYCVPEDQIDEMAKVRVCRNFNPGIIRVRNGSVDLDRIERYLSHSQIWFDKMISYFSELTIWAMELSQGAHRALGKEYVLAAFDNGGSLTAGHFCGNPRIKTITYAKKLMEIQPMLLDRENNPEIAPDFTF